MHNPSRCLVAPRLLVLLAFLEPLHPVTFLLDLLPLPLSRHLAPLDLLTLVHLDCLPFLICFPTQTCIPFLSTTANTTATALDLMKQLAEWRNSQGFNSPMFNMPNMIPFVSEWGGQNLHRIGLDTEEDEATSLSSVEKLSEFTLLSQGCSKAHVDEQADGQFELCPQW